MNVCNCRKCGRIFNYVVGQRICPACKEEAEATFQKVKKYIEEKPYATILDIVEDCEVEQQQITQWLREERLELKQDSGIAIPCESCGAPITSGKYCEKCKRDLAKGFNDAIRSSRPANEPGPIKKRDDGSNKMRFLNN